MTLASRIALFALGAALLFAPIAEAATTVKGSKSNTSERVTIENDDGPTPVSIRMCPADAVQTRACSQLVDAIGVGVRTTGDAASRAGLCTWTTTEDERTGERTQACNSHLTADTGFAGISIEIMSTCEERAATEDEGASSACSWRVGDVQGLP